MASRDIIEVALTSPMDWEHFESMVAEILQRDDFPRLRKIGGRADQGIDAVEERFYEDESRINTVVQITSQRAQVAKFRATVQRLRKADVFFRLLVLVFRQPVASTTRTDIQSAAFELSISVDIRDQSYLISQLAKPNSNIYSRYFEDIGQQVNKLLTGADPLAIAPDPLRHAMLASLGAYVLNPHARIARRTLFEKTVLATVVSIGDADIGGVIAAMQSLIPEEHIDEARLRPALHSLRDSGDIGIEGKRVFPKETALVSVGRSLAASRSAYDGLRDHILDTCSEKIKLDDASKGYLERNLRRALLALFRGYGPIDFPDEAICIDYPATQTLLECFSCDMPAEVARLALLALGAYLEERENVGQLAMFARSYTALAIRNLDPLGRRWQQAALSRSVLALDTDAILYILINELSEHDVLLRSLRSLQTTGFRLAVSEKVISEATGHLERAERSYSRFKSSLERMSPAMVDSQVWHAIVRGYYYATQRDKDLSWRVYWRRYYDEKDPEGYLRFQLGKVLNIHIQTLDEIPEGWLSDLEAISADILAAKEPLRLKAEFRDPEQMRRRAYDDVRMAMHLASFESRASMANAKGYLVSEDRGFLKAQRHPNWPPRPHVLILTHAVPGLAGFLSGEVCDDDELVRLLFDPAISAAATLMEKEIKTLTSLGIDLRTVSLGRLEWDLSSGLYEAVHDFENTPPERLDERLENAVGVLESARQSGLPIDPAIGYLAESYKAAAIESAQARVERQKLEDIVRRVALAAGQTKKARRRVNQVLREIGIGLGDLDIGDADPE